MIVRCKLVKVYSFTTDDHYSKAEQKKEMRKGNELTFWHSRHCQKFNIECCKSNEWLSMHPAINFTHTSSRGRRTFSAIYIDQKKIWFRSIVNHQGMKVLNLWVFSLFFRCYFGCALVERNEWRAKHITFFRFHFLRVLATQSFEMREKKSERMKNNELAIKYKRMNSPLEIYCHFNSTACMPSSSRQDWLFGIFCARCKWCKSTTAFRRKKKWQKEENFTA